MTICSPRSAAAPVTTPASRPPAPCRRARRRRARRLRGDGDRERDRGRSPSRSDAVVDPRPRLGRRRQGRVRARAAHLRRLALDVPRRARRRARSVRGVPAPRADAGSRTGDVAGAGQAESGALCSRADLTAGGDGRARDAALGVPGRAPDADATKAAVDAAVRAAFAARCAAASSTPASRPARVRRAFSRSRR